MDDEGEVILPETIDGQRVGGREGDYVVGEELLPIDDDAEITLRASAEAKARKWLAVRRWDKKAGYKMAWTESAVALSGCSE